MPFRDYSPFYSLRMAWQFKLAVALPGAWILNALKWMGAHFAALLTSDPVLIFAIAALLVADMLTGIAAALKKGERFSSRAFRRTGWKVLEYAALAFVGLVIANGFAGSDFHLLTDSLDDAALLYIALTEFMSVLENVTGSRTAARRLFRKITGWSRDPDGSLVMEEIVSSEPIDDEIHPTTEAHPLPSAEERTRTAGQVEPPPILPPSPDA